MRTAYFGKFLFIGINSVINLFRELDESSMFGVKFQGKDSLDLFYFLHIYPLFSTQTLELKMSLYGDKDRNQLRASPVKMD